MESTESFHKLFTHILTLNIHDVFMVNSLLLIFIAYMFCMCIVNYYKLLKRLVIYKSFNYFIND